jgi:hypothetical protein
MIIAGNASVGLQLDEEEIKVRDKECRLKQWLRVD